MWIGEAPLSVTFPRVFSLDGVRHATIRDQLTLGWDRATFKRGPRGGIKHEQWDGVLSLLQDFQLQLIPYRMGWIVNVFDTFFVSSTWRFLDESLLFSRGIEPIWINWVPIKISMFIYEGFDYFVFPHDRDFLIGESWSTHFYALFVLVQLRQLITFLQVTQSSLRFGFILLFGGEFRS